MVIDRRRDAWTAKKFLTKLIGNQPVWPEFITTEVLRSYRTALEILKLSHL